LDNTNKGQFLIECISISIDLNADTNSISSLLVSTRKYSLVVSDSVFLFHACLEFRILLGVSCKCILLFLLVGMLEQNQVVLSTVLL